MAAPTPVSAYLHSATMVKAGVILVAVTGPAFAGVAVWKNLGLTLGGASMLWGAIGALRHVDGKQILAWGTISQLGLMIVLLSLGEPKATFAALSIVVAHAAFKAALFMVVGEVDVRARTRDIRELDGLSRSMPIAFAVAVVSGASMVGVPPLLGFMAKEAAIEAGLKLKGFEAVAVTALVVVGSVLTAAYTVRFLIGMFGGRSDTPTEVGPRRWPMTLPAVSLAVLSVGGYAAAGTVTTLVRRAGSTIDPAAAEFALLRWPGFTTAFGLSVGIVAVGSGLGVALARSVASAPAAIGARLVDRGIDEVVVIARRVTARVQHGSLPVYLVVVIGVAALAGAPFWFAIDLDVLYRWDTPIQPILGLAVVVAALATARIGSRLGAALGLGGLGIGVAGLFATYGATDLVITQLLVETVVVVGFVIGLGHLTRRFPRADNRWLVTRVVLSVAAGVTVAGALVASRSQPTGVPPQETLVIEAVETGGGNNVVNVILTDTRGLDTLGEIVVLAVVAIGMLALGAAGAKRRIA
jgi:multicomponent Na+:H+ antiporter subunit A